MCVYLPFASHDSNIIIFYYIHTRSVFINSERRHHMYRPMSFRPYKTLRTNVKIVPSRVIIYIKKKRELYCKDIYDVGFRFVPSLYTIMALYTHYYVSFRVFDRKRILPSVFVFPTVASVLTLDPTLCPRTSYLGCIKFKIIYALCTVAGNDDNI